MTFAKARTTEASHFQTGRVILSQNKSGHFSLPTAQYFLSLTLCHCAPPLRAFPGFPPSLEQTPSPPDLSRSIFLAGAILTGCGRRLWYRTSHQPQIQRIKPFPGPSLDPSNLRATRAYLFPSWRLPAERMRNRARRLVIACPLLAGGGINPASAPPGHQLDGMESGHLLSSCCMSGLNWTRGCKDERDLSSRNSNSERLTIIKQLVKRI